MQVKPFEYMSESIKNNYEFFYPNWKNAIDIFGQRWNEDFNEIVLKFFGDNTSKWDLAIEGYVEFCSDAIKSQVFFEQTGHYKANSYAEVNKNYYQNDEFMKNCYLPGMLLAHYVWPHHQRLLLFFREIISKASSVKTFVEVGTGTGLYSLELLKTLKDSKGTGIDISGSSLDFTNRLIESYDLGGRYKTVISDVTKSPQEEYNFLVCQEVLEHLEDPQDFLKALHRMVHPSGYAYITAAVNAAHVDHIYLYRNEKEVLTQIEGAGFKVLDIKTEYASRGQSIDKTPSVSAFYCKRV